MSGAGSPEPSGGGMFVQSAEFVAAHGGKCVSISASGQRCTVRSHWLRSPAGPVSDRDEDRDGPTSSRRFRAQRHDHSNARAARPMTTSPLPDSAVNITHRYDDHTLHSVDSDLTIDWTELLDRLATGGTFWLTVIDGTGRPHTRPVLAVVVDGVLATASSATSAKTTALRAGGPTSIATSSDGIDIIWAGTSRRITDPTELAAVTVAYRSLYGWPADIANDALTAPNGAPTAGAPPYEVFRIDPITVHAIGTDTPFTDRSTKWSFTSTGHTGA